MTRKYLKPITLEWMKCKSGLNESETKELIQDVEQLHEEVKRLKQEREKLIEGLRWYADDKTYKLGVNITMGAAFPLHEPIKSDKGIRARDTLKSIGIDV